MLVKYTTVLQFIAEDVAGKLITKLFYNNMCVPGVDKIIILF